MLKTGTLHAMLKQVGLTLMTRRPGGFGNKDKGAGSFKRLAIGVVRSHSPHPVRSPRNTLRIEYTVHGTPKCTHDRKSLEDALGKHRRGTRQRPRNGSFPPGEPSRRARRLALRPSRAHAYTAGFRSRQPSYGAISDP